MSSDYFYSDLPVIGTFLEITDCHNFYPVPKDWLILVTDIKGSTQAIKSGRYKDVNFLGASSIIAVLNIAGSIEIPFIFGGDGATILIPPSLLKQAKSALLATRRLAKQEFGLDLRVGAVPVNVVTSYQHPVKVAKFRVSKHYTQAAFTGGGLTEATELIKNSATANLYLFRDLNSTATADFSGLECRWRDIPSKQGEVISLLVMATSRTYEQSNQIYRDVLEQIQSIYGDEDCLHPVAKEYLKLSFSYKKLRTEVKLRAKSRYPWDKLRYLLKVLAENLVGLLLMKFKVKSSDVDWGAYKDIILAATDYRKFDDLLRMVIAGNLEQRERLIYYLEKKYQEGKLVYGLHPSNHVLMTCLVFERGGRHVHFVDGADGGYAIAALSMKQKLKELAKIKL